MRRGRGVLLVAAVAALAAFPGLAEGGSLHVAGKTACQKLKGDDLAPGKNVKLVEEKGGGDKELRGCVLPDGKVRTVSSTDVNSDYTLRRVAGHQVLVFFSESSQYGSGSSTYVYDIKTGKHYDVAHTCYDDVNDKPCADQTTSKRARINAKGQAAAVIATKSGTRKVVGFSSKGERTVLDTGSADEIPASSLQLHHSVVTWTHSGEAKSATLSG